ncbi:transcription initiation factor IID, 18kDa subunit [Paraphysoderma sedebokerense]|nr:transcription initiation factor IID, 18kDa subunit [Paraphysoderma sedebokerense]
MICFDYLFTVKKMMYGFGDVINPDADSVECMEDLLMEFITEMCLEASKVSAPRVRVKTEDFLFVLRHDEKKLARAEELLIMAKDIARARKLIAEGTEVAYTAKE